MDAAPDVFLTVLDAYNAAAFAKDVDAFIALYADDVRVFDLWGTWSIHGADAWRCAVTEWFSSLGDERVIVDATDVQTTQAGDLAVGHAILTYTAFAADGERLRSTSNRMTPALRRIGASWKVFHEHTSAPVDHASMRAMLQYPNR